MRLMLVWEYYRDYWESFYARHPGTAAQPYQAQLSRLLDDHFGWPAAVARRLGESGHQVFHALANVEPLQRKWAEEEGLPFEPGAWNFTLPLAQARAFRPDVLWIGALFRYYGGFLREMRKLCPRVVAWIACPTPRRLDLSRIDLVLTSHENLAAAFRQQGRGCVVLRPAFDTRILDALAPVERDLAFTFVGSYSSFHRKRMQVLEGAVRETPLKLWGQGPLAAPGLWGWRSAAKRLLTNYHKGHRDHGERRGRFSSFLCGLCGNPLLEARYQGPAWGLEMYRVLQRSRLTLNVHGDIAGGLAGNMRLFEATGMGAMLLTEAAPNLSELFTPGAEVVACRDAGELVAAVKHYLEHDDERERIARAGQARTLKEHNALRRSQELVALLDDLKPH